MRAGWVAFCLLPICLSACASHNAAAKTAFDFSRIHRVAVLPFDGQGGDAVSNEFVRQLLAGGLQVTNRNKNVDAVLTGAVTTYKTGEKRVIFLGRVSVPAPDGQTVSVTNPVVSQMDTPMNPVGIENLPAAQIVSVNANVGVIAHLAEAATGRLIWAREYSYEGLDIQDTLQAVVATLAQSLRQAIPAMKKT